MVVSELWKVSVTVAIAGLDRPKFIALNLVAGMIVPANTWIGDTGLRSSLCA